MGANLRELAPRQRACLLAMQRSLDERGIMPTYRELAIELGVSSTNAVGDYLRALVQKGWIRIDDLRARNVVILFRTVPLFIERTVAGQKRVVQV